MSGTDLIMSSPLPVNVQAGVATGALVTPEFAWFGKLPSVGDFVSRRMPYSLLQFWDHFCASGMTSLSVGSAASGWDVWRGCPMWAFLLPGQSGIAPSQLGVLAPSCDRVGRNFPFLATLFIPSDHMTAFITIAADLGLAWAEVIANAQIARLGVDELDAKLQTTLSAVLMNPVDRMDSERTLPFGLSPSTLPWPDLASTFDSSGNESFWWSVPPAVTGWRAHTQIGALNSVFFVDLCEG